MSRIACVVRDDLGKKSPDLVIHEGHLKRDVGIGWVDEGEAKPSDYAKYPEVK